jgi:hypothetical protein
VNGTEDSNNILGVSLRSKWVALVKGDSSVAFIVWWDADGKRADVFSTKEFDSICYEAMAKCFKEVFAAYAQKVYEVETATAKLPYNSPKRQKQYWGVLNRQATQLATSYDIMSDALELAFVLGTRQTWPTNDKKQFDACKQMIRRKYKDTALAIRRIQADMAATEMSATAGAMISSATTAAMRQNAAITGFVNSTAEGV